MKTTKNVGFNATVIGQRIKEKVKSGEITARAGLDCLIAEAEGNGGAIGVAVFRGSKAAKWLSRRCL